MAERIFKQCLYENTDIHPTKKALIETFLLLAEQQGFLKIRIENVLKQSGISKGSLYHHFTDFDDLVGEAKAQVFLSGAKRTVDNINFMVEQSKSAKDIKTLGRALLSETLTVEGVRRRQMRARILGTAMDDPKLLEYVLTTQQWVTEEITEAVVSAKCKGLVKQDVDPHLSAVFVQTNVLGKIVDDVSYAPVKPDDWTDWVISILDYKIFA